MVYKGIKITKKTKSVLVPIREYDGHSSRNTGFYEEESYKVFIVNKKEFNTEEDARRYIILIKNKVSKNILTKKLKKLNKTASLLDKKLESIENKRYNLLEQLRLFS